MTLRLATAGAILALAAGLPRAEAQYQRDQLPSGVALERVGLERQWHNTVPMGLGSEKLLRITPAASSQTVNGAVAGPVVAAGGFNGGGDLLQPIDGVYNGWHLKFLDGPMAGQERVVASYRGRDRQFTFTTPWPAAPEAGARFALLDTMLYAQTTSGMFYAFDGETGQRLWESNLGQPGTRAFPASVNSRAVFVTTADKMIALDRGSGRPLWRVKLENYPSSPTACDEDLVVVGQEDGRLQAFHLLRGNVQFKSSLPTYTVPGGSWAEGEDAEVYRDLAYLREPLLAWVYKSDGRMTARPILAGDVVAFASGTGVVYAALAERNQVLYRLPTGDPVVAPLASYGVRTLLASSMDRNVYAIDLFTGETKWIHSTGAAVDQEPLVAGTDIFVQNTVGRLEVLDPETGEPRWGTETRGGTLLAVGQSRVYLKNGQGDLFVVDRKSGRILDDARSTAQVKGLNLRAFTLLTTNQINDRIYLATPEGSIVCIREAGRRVPTPLRDPAATPFGYIPPEGYPEDDPGRQAAPPSDDPFGPAMDDDPFPSE